MLNEEQAEFVHNAVCGVPDDQRKDGDEKVLGYLLEELDIILCRVQLSDPFDWLMDYTLTDKQRILIVNALKKYHAWLGIRAEQALYEKNQDEILWLIDLIDLNQYITLSDSRPTPDWPMDYTLTERQCGMIINALNIYVDNCPRSYIQEVETIIELLDDEVHAHYHGIKFATLN